MTNVFDITDFGAVPDAKQYPNGYFEGTDNTKAIQAALDAAGPVFGTVIVPPGRYMTGELHMPTGASIQGFPGWSYHEFHGSTLILNDPNAKCMLDVTLGFACRVAGIQFYGNRIDNKIQGENVHGVYFYEPWILSARFPKGEEDTCPYSNDHSSRPNMTPGDIRSNGLIIEQCQFRNLSGDGVHLENCSVFTMRQCQVEAVLGNGITANGFDGWISDNDFTNCYNYGISDGKNGFIASFCIDGNRFEWCRKGGIGLNYSDSNNIVNNFFDSNFGPGLDMYGEGIHTNSTIVGNTFRMNGTQRREVDWRWEIPFHEKKIIPFESEYESSHIRIKGGYNLAINSNTFIYGQNRVKEWPWRPDYSIVYQDLTNCTIMGNTMHRGAIKQNLVDLGGNENVEILCNPGSVGGPFIDYSEI